MRAARVTSGPTNPGERVRKRGTIVITCGTSPVANSRSSTSSARSDAPSFPAASSASTSSDAQRGSCGCIAAAGAMSRTASAASPRARCAAARTASRSGCHAHRASPPSSTLAASLSRPSLCSARARSACVAGWLGRISRASRSVSSVCAGSVGSSSTPSSRRAANWRDDAAAATSNACSVAAARLRPPSASERRATARKPSDRSVAHAGTVSAPSSTTVTAKPTRATLSRARVAGNASAAAIVNVAAASVAVAVCASGVDALPDTTSATAAASRAVRAGTGGLFCTEQPDRRPPDDGDGGQGQRRPDVQRDAEHVVVRRRDVASERQHVLRGAAVGRVHVRERLSARQPRRVAERGERALPDVRTHAHRVGAPEERECGRARRRGRERAREEHARQRPERGHRAGDGETTGVHERAARQHEQHRAESHGVDARAGDHDMDRGEAASRDAEQAISARRRAPREP